MEIKSTMGLWISRVSACIRFGQINCSSPSSSSIFLLTRIKISIIDNLLIVSFGELNRGHSLYANIQLFMFQKFRLQLCETESTCQETVIDQYLRIRNTLQVPQGRFDYKVRHTYIRTNVRMYVCTYIHTYVRTYVRTCIACMHACVRTYVRT